MKKTILLILLCVISTTATSQYYYVKMTGHYKRLINKRNVSNIDNSLYSLGWEEAIQVTTPNIFNGTLGYLYSKWHNDYLQEEIYLFDAKGNLADIEHQKRFIKDNLLIDGSHVLLFKKKRYILLTQYQDDVNILAVIFYDQHKD
tara:strand:- start:265 stop:699 length:435 start_codon:yes stop_codon:yes gene_type:complete